MKRYTFACYNIFKTHIPWSPRVVTKLITTHDFALIQEWVSSYHAPEHRHVSTTPTFVLPYLRAQTGTATFASHPITFSSHHLSSGKELGFTTRKSMTLTQYHLPEKLTVLNCHALNFVTTAIWKKTLRAWFNEIPLEGACIVAGDFNTWNMARLNHLHQFLYSKGFSYVPYKGNEVLRLDHIYVRGIHVEDVVCHTNMHTSDHYPITMTFSILP